MTLLFFLASPSLGASVKDGLRQAIEYVERQDRSEATRHGRYIPSGAGLNGIDINSLLEIKIDRDQVFDSLSPMAAQTTDDADIRLLKERAEALTAVVDQVRNLARAAESVVTAFQSPDATVNQYEDALDTMGTLGLEIFHAIQSASSSRFVAEGQSTAEASANARDILNRFFVENPPPGYNYLALTELIALEIRSVNRAIDHLVRERDARGIEVEVRAYLVGKDGNPAALRLPGYNEVEVGPRQPYRKIQFNISEEEKAVYEQMRAAADSMEEAQSLAEAVKSSVRVSFDDQISALRDTVDEIRGLAEGVVESLHEAAEWIDGDALEGWIRDLPGSPVLSDGVRAALGHFATAVADTKTNLDQLRQLSDTLESIRASPVAAYDAITSQIASGLFSAETWEGRLRAGNDLIDALGDADLLESLRSIEGPVKAWFDAKEPIETLVQRVQQVIKEFSRSESVRIAESIDSLPEPTGQKRIPLTEDLDTELELQTIKGHRQEKDDLLIVHRFFVKDQPVGELRDRFRIEVYGWRSKVLAGLAFARGEKANEDDQEFVPEDSWKAAPVMTWVLSRRNWPKLGKNGLKGQGTVGFGVSVMPLNFDVEQDSELGIGITGSFFRDFVQVGYGINLNTSGNDDFFFFAIRAVQFSKLFNPANKQ